MAILLDGVSLTLRDVVDISKKGIKCEIAHEALSRVAENRADFEKLVAQNIPIYGVTTGYGEMVYMFVETDNEVALQTNLVRSICTGVGPSFCEEESRAMLVARINALSRGYSAVRTELLERMLFYLNEGIIPVIPEIGSLGASGDLAPLSHMAITLIGEGYVCWRGHIKPTHKVLREHNIEPLQLKFKEGLALINGTSAMTGLGALVVEKGYEQTRQAEIVAALVLEVLQASSSPFLAEGHEIARPHQGQIDCARNIRVLTQGSQLLKQHQELRDTMLQRKSQDETVHRTDVYLQKAYSLRCIPQIIGGVRDTLAHASTVLTTELNSSNDNPLFFADREVFHGGNFHGQPVAFVLDFTAIALTELGVLSERRTNRLLNRFLNNGLPEFLVQGKPGLENGLMGTQFTATALVAENRTIGPASTQSVPSNGDNQDVVSMGLISGRNARRILANNQYILAVEYLAAAQAVDILRCQSALSKAGQATYRKVRELVKTVDGDRFMSDDLETLAGALSRGEFARAISEEGITLA